MTDPGGLERELRQANAFLEAILENIPDMIFVKDASELRFVRVNRAGEELLGYPRTALIGRSDFEFFPKAEAEFFRSTDRRVLESGEAADIPEEPIDTRLLGKRFLHTKKVGILGPDGKPEFLLGISEDVTDLRRRTLDLRAAVEELESFSYTVSHDLRAPLRAIDGFTALVLEDHGPGLGADGREALGKVRAAALRMNGLIDALLKLAGFAHLPIQLQPVDLSAAARTEFNEVRRAFPERRFRFTCAQGATALGDPALLGAVLANLIANAAKFTAEAAEAEIEFGTERSQRETVFFVRDNGCGFDMADVENLFKPFRRLHDAGGYPGSGIGLATVRRIVARHGGRVWARAEPGRGAAFYFTLPVAGAIGAADR